MFAAGFGHELEMIAQAAHGKRVSKRVDRSATMNSGETANDGDARVDCQGGAPQLLAN